MLMLLSFFIFSRYYAIDTLLFSSLTPLMPPLFSTMFRLLLMFRYLFFADAIIIISLWCWLFRLFSIIAFSLLFRCCYWWLFRHYFFDTPPYFFFWYWLFRFTLRFFHYTLRWCWYAMPPLISCFDIFFSPLPIFRHFDAMMSFSLPLMPLMPLPLIIRYRFSLRYYADIFRFPAADWYLSAATPRLLFFAIMLRYYATDDTMFCCWYFSPPPLLICRWYATLYTAYYYATWIISLITSCWLFAVIIFIRLHCWCHWYFDAFLMLMPFWCWYAFRHTDVIFAIFAIITCYWCRFFAAVSMFSSLWYFDTLFIYAMPLLTLLIITPLLMIAIIACHYLRIILPLPLFFFFRWYLLPLFFISFLSFPSLCRYIIFRYLFIIMLTFDIYWLLRYAITLPLLTLMPDYADYITSFADDAITRCRYAIIWCRHWFLFRFHWCHYCLRHFQLPLGFHYISLFFSFIIASDADYRRLISRQFWYWLLPLMLIISLRHYAADYRRYADAWLFLFCRFRCRRFRHFITIFTYFRRFRHWLFSPPLPLSLSTTAIFRRFSSYYFDFHYFLHMLAFLRYCRLHMPRRLFFLFAYFSLLLFFFFFFSLFRWCSMSHYLIIWLRRHYFPFAISFFWFFAIIFAITLFYYFRLMPYADIFLLFSLLRLFRLRHYFRYFVFIIDDDITLLITLPIITTLRCRLPFSPLSPPSADYDAFIFTPASSPLFAFSLPAAAIIFFFATFSLMPYAAASMSRFDISFSTFSPHAIDYSFITPLLPLLRLMLIFLFFDMLMLRHYCCHYYCRLR